MNRANFLKFLLATPLLGFLKPPAKTFDLPLDWEDKDGPWEEVPVKNYVTSLFKGPCRCKLCEYWRLNDIS